MHTAVGETVLGMFKKPWVRDWGTTFGLAQEEFTALPGFVGGDEARFLSPRSENTPDPDPSGFEHWPFGPCA